MTITLYDLTGADDAARFSPNCWRTRMALAHKGLDVDARATRFTEIPTICGGGQKQIPVIEDGEAQVALSWPIALYLEETYPERPSLFGDAQGRAHAAFLNAWADRVLHPALIRLVIHDIYEQLSPVDHDYFRQSRESRFGQALEDIQANRDTAVEAVRSTLSPVREVLREHDWLGGDTPRYGDYLVFGALQWARVASPFQVLAGDDPIRPWFERSLDLFDGLGRKTPAAA